MKRLFLISVMCLLGSITLKVNAQCAPVPGVSDCWIFDVMIWTWPGCTDFDVRLYYDVNNTPENLTDDTHIFTQAVTASDGYAPPIFRRFFSLPIGVTSTKLRVSVAQACYGRPYNEFALGHILDGRPEYCYDFSSIAPESMTIDYEIEGSVYKSSAPVADESGCDLVTINMPTHCGHYFSYGGRYFPITYEISDDTYDTRTLGTSVSYNTSTSVTAETLKALYPETFRTDRQYTVKAYDGTFVTPPSASFRVRSARPQLTYDLINKVCDKNGGVEITGRTVSDEIEQINIQMDWGGLIEPDIDVPKGDLIGLDIESLLTGTFTLKARNINAEDADDDCEAVYPGLTINPTTYTVNLNLNQQQHETCFESNNGYLEVSPGNGRGPYSYSWTKNPSATSIGSNNYLDGLNAGVYNVSVKDDNGCVGSRTGIEVNQPAEIIASATPGDVSCNLASQGENDDGIITFSAEGGVNGNFQYSINNGANYYDDPVFRGKTVGTYTVIVRDRDRQSCTKALGTVSIGAPDPVSYDIGSVEVVHPDCPFELGTFSAVGTGGSGGYQYSTDNISYGVSNEFNLSGSPQPGTTRIIYIKDSNNCVDTVRRNIISPQPLTFNVSVKPKSCPEKPDGRIRVSVNGGTGSKYISLNSGSYFPDALPTVYPGLDSGVYTIDVEDANACQSDTTVRVFMKPLLSGEIQVVRPISCYGDRDGILQLTNMQGGTLPYTFLWTTDSTGISVSGLGDGSYGVVISDSVGCKTEEIAINFEEPEPLTISDSIVLHHGYGISCNGANDGTVHLTVEGGTPGYIYDWSGPANYDVEDPSGMPPGEYSILVTDGHYCQINIPTITITEPTELTLSLESRKDIRCYGGSDGAIRVIPGGGVWQEPYEYTADISLLPWQDSVQFLHLSARSYTVYIRDANNCTATLPVTLTEPPLLELSLEDTTNTLCGYSNGSAEVSATGGSPGYVFTWYDEFFSGAGTGTKLSNLPAGVYMATVHDSHDCLDSVEVFIENSDGPVITRIDTLISPPRCHDTGDGTVGISISQGQTPYSIQWRVNGVPSAVHTTEELEDLAGGIYTARVTDAEGCMDFETISIPAPLPLHVSEELVNPVCVGSSDGSVTLTASGGNGGYGYIWTHGPSGAQITGLSMGTYTVEIRDSKNCILHHTSMLSDPPPTIIDIGEDRTICVGQQVRIVPGLPGTYAWTSDNGFNSTSSEITVGEEGVYRVVYTSLEGCIAEDEMRIVTSTDLLQADFLMISEAHAGDTVLIIDISWPLPDNIGWQFPEGVTTLSSDGPLAEVIFNDPGEYTVTLNASIGECIDDLVKLINILEARPDFGERQAAEGDFIRDVQISPNPTDGRFSVAVELREQSHVYAAIVTQDGSRILYSLSDEGESSYQWDINLPPVSAGLYYLIVKAGDKVKVLRLIKT